MAAASGGSTAVAASEGTARPRPPAKTGGAGFPRPFLFVPVTQPGSITRDNPVPINALGLGLGRRAGSERIIDLLIGLADRLLPCAGREISIPADVGTALAKPWLEAAQDHATRPAIGDLERAGIDIIIDGEIRRESYSNRLATALAGVDLDNPATVMGRSGGTVVVPRITGPIRGMPVELRNVELLRANTDRTIKFTLPGPFTMSRQAKQLTGG